MNYRSPGSALLPSGACAGVLSLLLALQAATAPAASAASSSLDFLKAQTSRPSADTTLGLVPDYLETIEDPFYGGLVTRITGEPGTAIPNLPGRTWDTANTANYPSLGAWNADGSLIYLMNERLFLDGVTYQPLNLPRIPGGSTPMWSTSEPDIMLLARFDYLRKFNVRTGEVAEEIKIPGYSNFSTQIRTSPSNDGTRIGVKAQRNSDGAWMCLGIDLTTGHLGQAISFDDWNFSLGGLPEDKARRCSVMPSSKLLLLNGYANGSYNDQAHFFDWNTGELVFRQRYNGGDVNSASAECPGGHGDIGLDGNGDDVLVGTCKGGGLAWTEPFRGKTVALRPWDGKMWVVGPSSDHTSCRNTGRTGWCYGSIFGDSSSLEANRLDGNRTEFYADPQGSSAASDDTHVRGNPSPDGRKILFSTSWNGEVLPGSAVFVLNLSPIAGSADDGGSDDVAADYTLKKAAAVPVIDGLLGEYVDASTAQVTAGDSTAVFRSLWDDDALYIAFGVTDWDLQAEITDTDGKLWTEDGVELFLDLGNNGGNTMDGDDFHFIVTTINTQGDSDAAGSNWDTDWESAVSRTAEGYAVELRIPWSSVGFAGAAAGDAFGLSFALNDKDGDSKVHAQWGGYTAKFRTPSQWKGAELSGATASSPTACPVY